MQTVIIAGGLGTRLGSITQSVPKPMVLINGKPYLEYQIEYLKEQDFLDILLLTGHLGEKIRNYFNDGSSLGVRILYSSEDRPLGTGGALRRALPMLDNVFLILYGDSFLPIDYHEVVKSFYFHNKTAMLVAYDNSEDIGVVANVCFGTDGIVADYRKEGGQGFNYTEAGVLILKKQIIDTFPEDKEISLEKEVFPKLIKENNLCAYVTNQRFYDIGTPERLREAARFFKK